MRVAIVNDLRIATEALRSVLVAGGHQVAWTALDGKESVVRAKTDPPELILMDLVMPIMDGAEATRQIRITAKIPILVVTSSVAANFDLATKAMSHGALDVVLLPTIKDDPAKDGSSLLKRLKNIQNINIHTEKISSAMMQKLPYPPTQPYPPYPSMGALSQNEIKLVVIGGSTGGPAAFEKIVLGLGSKSDAAFIFLQHIGGEFCESFAKWLGRPGYLPLSIAQPGEKPTPGKILLANSDRHLIMKRDGSLDYSIEPTEIPFLPSVDVFMESLALNWKGVGIAGILTGIGRDGAKGLLALHQKGWTTFAQDEATSVVHGMPKAAADLGAAKYILPIDQVTDFLQRQLSKTVSK